MKKMYLTLAAVATMFAACSSEDVLKVDEMTDIPVTVKADVAELNSRAGHATGDLETGSMGLYFTTTNVTDDNYNAKNREVAYNDDSWNIQGNQLFWKDASTSVTYKAYHPYDASATTDGTVTVTATADQTNGSVTDFLYAKEFTTDYNNSKNGIAISFEHQMTKLIVEVSGKENSEFATLSDVASVTVSGTLPTNTFSVETGSWGTATGTATDIQMEKQTDKKTFEAILIPQTVSNFVVSIAVGNRTFKYTTTDFKLTQGKAHTLSLEIGKAGATVGNSNVGEWGNGDNTSGEAEEVVNYELKATDPADEDHPYTYHVYNAKGLVEMNAHITDADNIDRLTYDIILEPHEGTEFDMSGKNWTPIGDGTNAYTGSFDGKGYAISNLTTTGDYAGLIAYAKGTVQNLTLNNPTITGTSNATGGIAGSIGTGATVSNCKVIGGEINSSGMQVGGIVGKFSYGTIIGCTVSGTNINGKSNYNGGIAGHVEDTSCTIIACHVNGATVTGTDRTTGSIVGTSSNGKIIGCFAYSCTPNRIAGTNDDKKGTSCCYTTNGSTFSHVGGTDVTDWSGAMNNMNAAISSYNFQWIGESAEEAEINPTDNNNSGN